MIGPIFEYDDLKRLSRLGEKAQLATVERWAKKIGLKYSYDGRGGIWTTANAMDAAVGLEVKGSEPEMYSVDMIVG